MRWLLGEELDAVAGRGRGVARGDRVEIIRDVGRRVERRLQRFLKEVLEWRNQGVGTALIVRSGNLLAAQGATAWTLAVTVGNPAQRLYERLGFRVDSSL